MTETQNPRPDHRAPLTPGEIRTHVVGNTAFQVMHVAGGSYTQATCRTGVDGPSQVIATERFESDAVRAYADAIEQAESDAVDALDDADGPSFTDSGKFIPDSGPDHVTESVRTLTSGGSVTLHPTGSAALHAQMMGRVLRRPEPVDLSFNLPMGADMQLVTGERPMTAPSLADDVAALRADIMDPTATTAGMLARLDRIAAQMPVATRVWMHRCGSVMINDTEPPSCHFCVSTPQIPFQRLYTRGEVR